MYRASRSWHKRTTKLYDYYNIDYSSISYRFRVELPICPFYPPHLHCRLSPVGWFRSNFAENFGVEKLWVIPRGVVCVNYYTCSLYKRFAFVTQIRVETYRRTDRQTHDDGRHVPRSHSVARKTFIKFPKVETLCGWLMKGVKKNSIQCICRILP